VARIHLIGGEPPIDRPLNTTAAPRERVRFETERVRFGTETETEPRPIDPDLDDKARARAVAFAFVALVRSIGGEGEYPSNLAVNTM
jgi:hypothetical protein